MTQPNPAPTGAPTPQAPPAGPAPTSGQPAPTAAPQPPPAAPGQVPAPQPGQQQPTAPAQPAPPAWPQQPYPGQAPAPYGQPGQPAPPWTPPAPTPPSGQEPTGDSGQGDGDRDLSKLPQWAQTQITGLRKEAADRRVAARTATVGQHAHQVASQAGVNPAALLGSTAWQQAAAQLDPNAADYGQRLTWTVQSLLAQNPWMAAPAAPPPPPGQPGQPAPGQPAPGQPAPPAQSGGDFSAGTGAGQPISEAQLAQMSAEEIDKALSEGKLKHLL